MRSEYLRQARAYWEPDNDAPAGNYLSVEHVQEERLRRMMLFADRLHMLAPVFHGVFCAFGGDTLFRAAFGRFGTEVARGIVGRALVTDTFHPQFVSRALFALLGKRSMRCAERSIYDLFLLEFARWRARTLVSTGSDPAPSPSLQPGASIIASSYDLIGVFGHANRLVSARLPEVIIRTQIGFVGPPTLVAIRPEADEVVEYAFRGVECRPRMAVAHLRRIAPALAAEVGGADT